MESALYRISILTLKVNRSGRRFICLIEDLGAYLMVHISDDQIAIVKNKIMIACIRDRCYSGSDPPKKNNLGGSNSLAKYDPILVNLIRAGGIKHSEANSVKQKGCFSKRRQQQ